MSKICEHQLHDALERPGYIRYPEREYFEPVLVFVCNESGSVFVFLCHQNLLACTLHVTHCDETQLTDGVDV